MSKRKRSWILEDPFGVLERAGAIPPRRGTGTSPSDPIFGGQPPMPQGPFTADVGPAASSGLSPASGSGTAGIGNLLPWLYPTADFKNVDKFGAVALPAIGTWADILVFNTEQGRCLKLTQLGIDFVPNAGAAYTQGVVPAQLKFFIGVNGSPATPTRPGKPFADYSPPNFLFLPGAVSAPTPINGVMVRERDEVHVSVFNVNIVVSTQSLAARVLAYSFSKKYWSKLMGPQ